MMTQKEFKKLIELDKKLDIEGERLFKILKEYGIFYNDEIYEVTEWNIEDGLTIQTGVELPLPKGRGFSVNNPIGLSLSELTP